MRGENGFSAGRLGHGQGTSPRARGKRRGLRFKERFKGNIPACAGKTGIMGAPGGSGKEHPRVRGENGFSGWKPVTQAGTSPRARGKPHRMAQKGPELRNIPACAGKTSAVQDAFSMVEEHPRVRGENVRTLGLAPGI